MFLFIYFGFHSFIPAPSDNNLHLFNSFTIADFFIFFYFME